MALDSGKPVVVIVTGGRPYNLGRARAKQRLFCMAGLQDNAARKLLPMRCLAR
ncbi:hypothetical protein JCM19239_3580 [Vibrio variabilis]|uniref:Uncharacterized protein n=1 Tax=Vibrio variabilis TaxID=990271 RepID=A0ABQ0JHU6_9VIBR|nr:hypothetical protein JCM19239_3580 [Vibrio variabilis]